jgi:alpha-D-ribose 1-methylphosphonate 5-triphosphate synthase subunit PhnG
MPTIGQQTSPSRCDCGEFLQNPLPTNDFSAMRDAVDPSGTNRALQRASWMALLARAPLELLESDLGSRVSTSPHWQRAPKTGLMMVQGRIGGSGKRFNLGEVTVTRCALHSERPGAKGPVGAA